MLNLTKLGGSALGVTGIAGRPVHDSPATSSVSGTTTADTSANSVVSWTYSQAQGDAQAQYRVYGLNAGRSTTYYDSGWLTGAGTTHSVGMDTEGIPTTSTTVINWQVDVRSDDYLSEQATSRYEGSSNADTSYVWGDPQCAIVTIEGVAPSGSAITIEQATDITVGWTFTDGANTQHSYRVQVRDSSSGIVRTDSGWVVSTVTTYNIPFTFSDGSRYDIVTQLKNNFGVRSS